MKSGCALYYVDHVRKRSRNALACLSCGYSVTEYEMGCVGQLVWRPLLSVLYDFLGGMPFVCCRDLLKSYLFLLFCLDTLLYTLCLYGRNLFNSLSLRFCLLLIGFYQNCVNICNALNCCISFRFYQ